jgi:hypothetical protein
LASVTIVTIAPFAALAIDGMSFRGGTDCAATTPPTIKHREISFGAKRLTIFISSTNSYYIQTTNTAALA